MKKIITGIFVFSLSMSIGATTVLAQEYKTVIEAAVATEDLSTLVTAVVAAELAGTLSSEGPFTVFAPVNQAFANLPEGTLESLLADPKGALSNVLTYHVVAGDIRSTDLVNGNVSTVNGKNIVVNIDNGVKINNANVIIADIVVGNGVVHVIDSVLLPPTDMTSTYTVISGDSLSAIALKYYGNLHAFNRIFDANRNILSNPNLIFVGQVLTIPSL
jgi:uncharacterized surface protein with fasciclin (FAS1) repeats